MLDKNKKKEHAKKLRGDWGDIKPITRIIPNKKKKTKDKHSKRPYQDAYRIIFI